MKYTVMLAHKLNEEGDEEREEGVIEVNGNQEAFDEALEYAVERSRKDDKSWLVVGLTRGD